MKVIPLTRGKYTIVDDEDYERLIQHSWAWVPATGSCSGKGYAVRKGNRKRGEPRTIQMHREILNAPKGTFVDHINLDSLDNRKENLRFVNVQQNSFNKAKPIMDCTSKYKGVFRRKNAQAWTARIKFNNRHVELGTYKDEEKAAAVYNFASRLLFGRYRHENSGVSELTLSEQRGIFERARRYIEKYGWYVDTNTYRSFFMEKVSVET